MIFEADWRTNNTRYRGGLICLFMLVLFFIFRPLTDSRSTHYEFFRTLLSLEGVYFLAIMMIFSQVNLYLVAHGYTKKIDVSNNFVKFYLFSFFKYKEVKINYTNVESLEYHKNPRIFIFNLKSGEKLKLFATVNGREELFNLLQKSLGKLGQG